MDIICINDQFTPEWEIYFQKQGIVKPVKGKVYSIRAVVNYVQGDKGVLLNEIVNRPTPRVSPTTGLTGSAEQSWSIKRFTDLKGSSLTASAIQQTITSTNHSKNP